MCVCCIKTQKNANRWVRRFVFFWVQRMVISDVKGKSCRRGFKYIYMWQIFRLLFNKSSGSSRLNHFHCPRAVRRVWPRYSLLTGVKHMAKLCRWLALLEQPRPSGPPGDPQGVWGNARHMPDCAFYRNTSWIAFLVVMLLMSCKLLTVLCYSLIRIYLFFKN